MRAHHADRGASAVEFALVLPVLIALVFGIAAFGHAYWAQTTLSNAARDGVRVVAIQNTTGGSDPVADGVQRAVDSASALGVTADQVEVTAASAVDPDLDPNHCGAEGGAEPGTATLVITYPLELLGGLGNVTLTGKGTMRCNG